MKARLAFEGGQVGSQNVVLRLVLIRIRLAIYGVGGFGQLLGFSITNVEADHLHRGMIRRLDLHDAIVNLSSKPVRAGQPSRRTATEVSYHSTKASNEREVKCATIAKAVETALHKLDDNINIGSLHKLFGEIDGKVVLGVGCDTGPNYPFLLGAEDPFPLKGGSLVLFGCCFRTGLQGTTSVQTF